FRDLQKNTLHMNDDDLWTAADIPMTGGALVAATLSRWLYGRQPNKDLFKWCCRKLGVLDPGHKNYEKCRDIFRAVVGRYADADRLARDLATGTSADLNKFMQMKGFLTTALGAAGVRWWAGRPVTETAIYNALVTGGRCTNERPDEYRMGRGCDIDISG